ncbi:LLM class flavin-dependent oxidoreductase [Kitasatospora sp. NPDC006697]|uniref:LLM class flavin-dependent oxidoreductase n=1 Tax=Kitasatospora sp. NPDC006697 TaxID=3364020 RepID=UPI0036CF26F3
MNDAPLHLAAALDGAGWHPAAWREPTSRPGELFTARYWADQVAEAEAGLLDFVTLEDALGPQSSHFFRLDERTDQVRGRLDAVLTAARVAPLTRRIGLVPTVVSTHTEPFHVSKAIATLDYVSKGRAGLRIQITARYHENGHFGRRTLPPFNPDHLWDIEGEGVRELSEELFGEAADHVEVQRRLWDSWEDDAVIRDAATGRFVDRAKLHYIDFEGPHFSVRGPAITPRPPQGQPLVTALAHSTIPYRLVAKATDLGYVTPFSPEEARETVAEVRGYREAGERAGEPLHLFGEFTVVLGASAGAAADRLARLDELAGQAYTSDAPVFTGTPAELADLLLAYRAAGLSGFRLRPAVQSVDLPAITRGLVPELQQRGAFRRGYEADTLRGHLGLDRPASRYAAA